jgi:hypothetical protein
MKARMEIGKTFHDTAKEQPGGDFPDSLPMEQAYVHISTYLGWMIESKLNSNYFEEKASADIFRFKGQEIASALLSDMWNAYLVLEFLNKTGDNFTLFYYTSGLYRRDYQEVLGRELPAIYHVDNTWPNYHKLKDRINTRYQEWVKLKTLFKSDDQACKLRVAV